MISFKQGAMISMHLPSDCVLLPAKSGSLLVSPLLGTYCAIKPEEIESIESLLHSENNSKDIHNSLAERLQSHGFFGDPRPFRPGRHLLQFQITNACNLRCAYCSACSGSARPDELTFDQVKQVIDEAQSLFPDIHFSFTGGEPLIIPWIFDAIDYAKSHSRYPVAILSNLLLLKNNPDLFQKTVDHMKDGLQVSMSISGADRDVCNRLSGRKCYDDAIEIINQLNRSGVLPRLDVMLSAPDAQANIDAFADFRRSLPRNMKISIATIYPCGNEKGEHVFIDEDKFEETLDLISFEGGVAVPAQKQSPTTNRRKACQCVENENLYIRSDGTIFSCFKLVESFGHISEGLQTVVNRRRQTATHAKDLEMCRNCPFVSLCASGCRADNYILSNSTKAPICGKWRRQLITEMLFEDKPYIFDWHICTQLTEARKRGISVPEFIITQLSLNGSVLAPQKD